MTDEFDVEVTRSFLGKSVLRIRAANKGEAERLAFEQMAHRSYVGYDLSRPHGDLSCVARAVRPGSRGG